MYRTIRKHLPPQRPESHASVDLYCWIRGKDKFPHKIGFNNRKAVIEKIDDMTLRLTEDEQLYYTEIFNNQSAKKG